MAALLACLFVVMAAADTLVCADGCTDEVPVQTTTPQASAPCAFCIGWRQSPVVVPAQPAVHPAIRLVATIPALATPFLSPLELPPKAA